MADEYISKQAFNDAIREAVRKYPNTFYNGLEVARQIAHDMDAADVAPVRHGRWRLLTNEEMRNRGPFGFLWASNSWMNYECSECGEMVHNELKGRGDSRTNYCPNCGAKMDGGD